MKAEKVGWRVDVEVADFPTEDWPAQVAALCREVEQLRHEKADLALMLELTAEHADNVTDELQELTVQLQQAVFELQNANAALSKRSLQLETSSRVARQVTSTLALDELLVAVVNLIQAQFGYYFVGLWLLDEDHAGMVLQASRVSGEDHPLEPGFVIPLDTPNSIIVSVCQSLQPYLTDQIQPQDRQRIALTSLPLTCSELVLPLHFGERKIGVLDIHSDQIAAFTADDQTVLQMLADQIAVAIHNARLYRLEKDLHQLEATRAQELAELNASKDKFFSIVAHDLRGPFQPLLGNAQLLEMMALDLTIEDIQDMSRIIHRSAQQVFSLLEGLLQWARLQMGRIEYQPVSLNLKQLADNSVELLTEMAKSKAITLQNEVPVEIRVYADEHMLDTVLRNLINNALKFTPKEGQVTIKAEIRMKDENKEIKKELYPSSFTQSVQPSVVVSVVDTGVGMSEENLSKLFKIGLHYSTTGTAREKGTGLGLLLCKEMVEKNGGQIWVESLIGQGTTVNFTVPLDRERFPPNSP